MSYLEQRRKKASDRYQSVKDMKEDLSSVLVSSRANEKKHSIEEDETNTVSIDRQDIKSKIKEENEQKQIAQTMQIPIVNEHHFQTSEAQIYEPPKKNVQKEEIRYCAYFTFISRKFIWFYSDGHVW